ncbi:MAG TPA: nickel pincer cofactor biosynthesis protein LarB [Planctomycetia bacterium]|nr:nickel pincer cofactor biosynthesis protein LarB [Planctomycetia bacterium]
MDEARLRELLSGVRRGAITDDAAIAALKVAPAVDLGFAQVDVQRTLRCGFPEVIFGQGKTVAQIAAIFARLAATGEPCLATRVDAAAGEELAREFPEASYDAVARTFWKPPREPLSDAARKSAGRVAVVCAGTSDLPVALEALHTVRAFGCETEWIVDVGVAGLHRLLARAETLAAQDAIVAVAGMEGTLPSVVGGLVACPVIAVPTSVGYGASFGGVSALLAMLTSCAANVAVVNIDAGFCGGYVAALSARRRAVAGP